MNLQSFSFAQYGIKDIQTDSRLVGSDSLFVAIVGQKNDGHLFLSDVLARSPRAILLQEDHQNDEQTQRLIQNFKGMVFWSKNTRQDLDKLAHQFWGCPSDQMICVGVTGTNGKTSLTFLIEYLLNHFGNKTGVIGTIDHHIGNKSWPSEMTTPDPLFLQKRLFDFRQEGATAVVMEVSSHALEQHRVGSVQFDGALFLNLTRDHLDYHQSMENYFRAKEKLFSEVLPASSKKDKFAVLNIKDPYISQIKAPMDIRVVAVGDSESQSSDFRNRNPELKKIKFLQYKIEKMKLTGCLFSLTSDEQKIDFNLPLTGEHNVQNAAMALATAWALGASWSQLQLILPQFPGIPGRLQSVTNVLQKSVFIDYAHSPDALENVLKALNKIRDSMAESSFRIWTVFGCGGDRDRGKRPLMAEISERFSDEVVVTSDNPRTEDPKNIIDEILAGFKKKKPHVEILRENAIRFALKNANAADIVLIAGKGHEDYQILGNQKVHFSDYEWVQKICKELSLQS